MRRGHEADTQMRHVFTVFTATFNRARVLHRVYDSLRAQTFRDFEWLVVDDGSTDGTGALVEAWRAEADFPIRYRYQENRGKHVACSNRARLGRCRRAAGMERRGRLPLDWRGVTLSKRRQWGDRRTATHREAWFRLGEPSRMRG